MSRRDAVLGNDVVLREYCDQVRRTMGGEFRYLHDAARELRRVLGRHGMVRAWLVARHLDLAASCAKHASAYAAATYFSFIKHYEPELTGLRSHTKSQPRRRADGFSFGVGSGGDQR